MHGDDRKDREIGKAQRAEMEAKLASIEKDMASKLARAQTDAERAQIKLEAERARAAASGGRSSSGSHSAKKAEEKPAAATPSVAKKRTINDNPLDGLDLK